MPHILLIFIFLAGNSIAGTTPVAGLPHASSLKANFIQTHYLPALTKPLITHGQISIDKTGFIWRISKPYQYTYRMYDGKMIEIDSQGQKTITTAEESPWIIPISNLFTALLSADTEKLESIFVLTKEITDNGIVLTMQPRSGAMKNAITRVQVWHSPWPEKIVIHENGGGILSIKLDIIHVETAHAESNHIDLVTDKRPQ